jgi:starch synthase
MGTKTDFSNRLHVAMVAPEIVPFAKTGGLGDVIGALPLALEALGIKLTLVMPAYRSVLKGDFHLEHTNIRLSVPISDRIEKGTVLKTKVGNSISVYFIRADKYFDREEFYATADGDYPDNTERFTFFSRSALEVLKIDPPSIIHAHDWQAALSIVFLKLQPEKYPELNKTRAMFTIHNLGYQGVFWNLDWHLLNLDWRYFNSKYLEFYNKINFLKGAAVLADIVTTVSPTYAQEIKTAENGFGLEGVFKEQGDKLIGVLNGIDDKIWNPDTDINIARNYSSTNLAGKNDCKRDLQKTFGLEENPAVPLMGVVARLTSQKGFDLITAVMNDLMKRNVQFVILGHGEKLYLEIFNKMKSQYPRQLAIELVFDAYKEHKVIAGADMIAVPSRYEPCGLTQMHGLRYGSVPVVRETGGLKDTVHEFNPETGMGNGFLFKEYSVSGLLGAIDRSLSVFKNKQLWELLVKNGMKEDLSWEKSARAYNKLYTDLISD